MGLFARIGEAFAPTRSAASLSVDDWASQWFGYGGFEYPMLNQFMSMPYSPSEEIASDFTGVVCGAYKSNAVVFACMSARMRPFSEARFQWQRLQAGRPGDLFGDPSLALLEKPWPNGTTGALLARMLQDADLAGNAYFARSGSTLRRLRPDWVSIVMGSQHLPDEPFLADDADILGYIYHPGGRNRGYKPVPFLVENVAHFAPTPDPEAHFRGMSWLTPAIREIQADKAATDHKLKFLENGATPNVVVKLDPAIKQAAFDEWVQAFEAKYGGVQNKYRTMYLGAGADVEVVGSHLREMDFSNLQGGGETRIAAAAGVPAIIAGLSEGLDASTYSNFGQAKRQFVDGTIRHLWREAAAALESVLPNPGGARLWYDARDIAYLSEDQTDESTIAATKASTIHTYITAGYEPASVVDAVDSGDLSRLKHTGLFSVQLQPPGAGQEPAAPGTPMPPPSGPPSRDRDILAVFLRP